MNKKTLKIISKTSIAFFILFVSLFQLNTFLNFLGIYLLSGVQSFSAELMKLAFYFLATGVIIEILSFFMKDVKQ